MLATTICPGSISFTLVPIRFRLYGTPLVGTHGRTPPMIPRDTLKRTITREGTGGREGPGRRDERLIKKDSRQRWSPKSESVLKKGFLDEDLLCRILYFISTRRVGKRLIGRPKDDLTLVTTLGVGGTDTGTG